MSTIHEEAEKRLDDNYVVTYETLSCDVGIPGRIMLTTIPITSVFLSSALVFYLITIQWNVSQNPIISLGIALGIGFFIFILGMVGGRIWVFLGNSIATATYMVYIDKDKTFFQKMFAALYRKFVENDAQVYLEARAKDPRLGNIINLVKLLARVSISQVSFFIVGMTFLARPLVEYLRSLLPRENPLTSTEINRLITQNLTALTLSVIVMSLYVPMSFLIEDSNIRTWVAKNRTVGSPSSTLRGKIDSLVGLGALISGWTMYQEQVAESSMILLGSFRGVIVIEGVDIALLVDYILWLFILMIMTWPLILPATYYYFLFYSRVVNKFRAEAYSKGVPIAITHARLPSSEEREVINEFVSKSLKEK